MRNNLLSFTIVVREFDKPVLYAGSMRQARRRKAARHVRAISPLGSLTARPSKTVQQVPGVRQGHGYITFERT